MCVWDNFTLKIFCRKFGSSCCRYLHNIKNTLLYKTVFIFLCIYRCPHSGSVKCHTCGISRFPVASQRGVLCQSSSSCSSLVTWRSCFHAGKSIWKHCISLLGQGSTPRIVYSLKSVSNDFIFVFRIFLRHTARRLVWPMSACMSGYQGLFTL